MSEKKEQFSVALTAAASRMTELEIALATAMRHEFYTPEHLLLVLLQRDENLKRAVRAVGADVKEMLERITQYLTTIEPVPDEVEEFEPSPSYMTDIMLRLCEVQVRTSGLKEADVVHMVYAMLHLEEESFARGLLREAVGGNLGDFMDCMLNSSASATDDIDYDELFDMLSNGDGGDEAKEPSGQASGEEWRSYVTCVSEEYVRHNRLIGREKELDRTIKVLCRKYKNNPLHIGEPGVGKTALVYGLAARIASGNVPERLRDSRIYQIDMGSLLAGTQYRGDFEKRLKLVMEGLSRERNTIVYIDEIHTIVGAGAVNGGSMDASNMLKPYLERGDIRFVGSTTYEEYNRHLAQSKGLVRRFSTIDIAEPTVEEAIEIARQLKGDYEAYHSVEYADEAIEFAVSASARHITDRFLPDKALDLIDEAGAVREAEHSQAPVDKTLMSEVLSKLCKVDALAVKEDDDERLSSLESRIGADIYGQPKAVEQVVEAVLTSKAGLLDEGKPLASLLFVGPTGVGKTEVARVLAREMGVELVRFDMSEYAEKHAVAKLIGSPAGYVGYEDGGLLTDAIRRTPNAVLLLDEIEKAHEDIYNILLQVMDYGRLTDNKGNHADFRNVVVIMTSNAGAQYASQASVGFGSRVTAGDAMMKEVKKRFKPEFLNRLTATVVFNDMDRTMASMILDKKLRQLSERLSRKNVTLTLSDAARELILTQGFTREYGARELDRVIASRLNPPLTRAILFGALKGGGTALVEPDGADGLKVTARAARKRRTTKTQDK